jgi:hypothetical protein
MTDNRESKMKTTLQATVVVVLVSAMYGTAQAASTGAPQRVIDMRTFDETYTRDDFDGRPPDIPALACELGFTTRTIARPGVACGVAYQRAVSEKRYEDAMRYATIGCQRDSSIESCRNVGGLPLWLGNQDIPVPPSFKGELRRVADHVCHSSARITMMNGKDVTARECSYLASRFTMARNPEYGSALRPEARRFFETIHEPWISASLHLAACQRFRSAASCNLAVSAMSEVEKLTIEIARAATK